MSKVKAVLDKSLSKYWEDRYVLVDTETGEVVDNAQGYGFKTQYGAYAAWTYKNRDRSKELKIHQFIKENRKILKLWNQQFWDIDDKPIDIVRDILKRLNLKCEFELKKVVWGIKDFEKIEKNIRKGKYNDIINS